MFSFIAFVFLLFVIAGILILTKLNRKREEDFKEQIIREIDREIERCEDMLDKYGKEKLMDRIQGILWVRNRIRNIKD